MKQAVESGLRADNPTRDVRAIGFKSDGFLTRRIRNTPL
jgi:hypothetical protein